MLYFTLQGFQRDSHGVTLSMAGLEENLAIHD